MDNEEPSILQTEVRNTIKQMEARKSAGPGNITREICMYVYVCVFICVCESERDIFKNVIIILL